MIATEQQRSRMQDTVPTIYSSIEMDQDGFIYATVSTVDPSRSVDKSMFVRKLNPMGNDVLRRFSHFEIMGDIDSTYSEGRYVFSQLSDVTISNNGTYSVLGKEKGRIFTYDFNGNLLYIFGGHGERFGQFGSPEALAVFDNDKYMVVDSALNQIILFKPTHYAQLVTKATKAFQDRDYILAEKTWGEALKYTTKSDLAYSGIGRAMLRNHKYLEAMEYFKLGNDRPMYSEAFKNYRKQVMKQYFGTFMTVFVIIIILFAILSKVLNIRKRDSLVYIPEENNISGKIKYAIKVIFHPFDGFWGLKHEKQGNLKTALVIFTFTVLIYIIRKQFTGFIINYNDLNALNILVEILKIALPFLIWCIANWCITTLLDGEGSFKDIVIVTSYSLIPIILINIPLVFMSNIMTLEEAPFYNLLDSISVIWMVLLLFIGIMTVHQYSVRKTLATSIASLGGMAIILFIGLLFFALIQQMLNFAIIVHKELLVRG